MLTLLPPPPPVWRSDIEGLRGISILMVVLYHAELPFFAGAYIGVDIFFTLSGYLITSILLEEVNRTGSIDLLRFYTRRVRRLLPASVLLLASVCVFAFFFYAPIEQQNIARTAIATSIYASNFYFAQQATDYLAADAEDNPLLHTWSLSVEEQFYLFWPLLILLLCAGSHRRRHGHGNASLDKPSQRPLVLGIIVFSIISFILTLYFMETGKTHWAFFSSPARAWEFSIGGFAAILPRIRLDTNSQSSGFSLARIMIYQSVFIHIAGWLGLGAIIVTTALYTAYTPFPGWAALPPVLGTICILRSGATEKSTPLNRLLSCYPLCELGRLSYSWYLWHWPVFVFAFRLYGEPGLAAKIFLIVLSLILAEASFRIVENPVRHLPMLSRKPSQGFILLAGLTTFSLVLSGSWWSVSESILRTSAQEKYAFALNDLPDLWERKCHADLLTSHPGDFCIDGPEDAPFTVVLYGDSHAAHWAPALQKIIARRNWRLIYLTKSNCPGIMEPVFLKSLGRYYTECDEWRKASIEIIRNIEPDLVITSAFVGHSFTLPEWHSGSEALFSALSEKAGAIAVFRGTPLLEVNVPQCLSRISWQRQLGFPFTIGRPCEPFQPDDTHLEIFNAQQNAASKFDNVFPLDPTRIVCPDDRCILENERHTVYWDTHHLAASYVQELRPVDHLAHCGNGPLLRPAKISIKDNNLLVFGGRGPFPKLSK